MNDSNESLTIEELSARTGLAVSTVRLYQTRKLLPAPKRHGRRAFYGAEHLTRLRLIEKMQSEGFSLAGIGQLVETWESGGDLRARLDVEHQVVGEVGRVLNSEDLSELFGDSGLDAEHAKKSLELGLIELTEGGQIRLPHPSLLEVGQELVAMGIPLGDVLNEYGHLLDTQRKQADRFVDLFDRNLWPQLNADESFAGDIGAVATLLGRLQSLAVRVSAETLRISIAEAAQLRITQESNSLLTGSSTP